MNVSGSARDNATTEGFFSSIKTDRIGRRMYDQGDDDKANVFDYIECFCGSNEMAFDHPVI
jgi:putative transposase